MNAITATTAATQAASAGTASQNNSSNGSVISSDFETFLKMLTAQLENQDPLNPLESQDFAVQLATFSNVEQQTKTNSLLEEVKSGLQASGLGDMSGWLGREARVTGEIPFTGQPVKLEPEFEPGALETELVVSDATGREIAAYSLNPSTDKYFTWNGLNAENEVFSPGIYTFKTRHSAEEGAMPDGEVAAYLPVIEARTGSRGTTLLLHGGLEVTPDAISALRQIEPNPADN